MVSLFALYRRPDDEAGFLEHYRTIHAPLARGMPGLVSLDWGLSAEVSSHDDAPWFVVAEMRFVSREAALDALRSSPGRAAANDVRTFAAGLLTMRMVEWQ